MTSERADTGHRGQIGREPLNLPLEARSARDAFLLVSSRLTRRQWSSNHLHEGNWLLSSSVDDLPKELASIATMLGFEDRVGLYINAKARLNSSKEPDFDSENEVTVGFYQEGCDLTYRYDNRSWRFGRRDPYHRMSLKFERIDRYRDVRVEAERQRKLLEKAGVFKRKEEAFKGLCEFLNHARLEVSYF